MAVYFSAEAADFPLRAFSGPKVAPGTIWNHLRAMIYPFFAAACWWVMSAFAVASSGTTAPGIYALFFMFFWVFIVIGIVLTIYLALRPLQETLEGQHDLTE
jgi:hypothetical protein